MGLEEHNFEAETGKVLNIVINSLYSNKDIFLREFSEQFLLYEFEFLFF